MEPQEDQRWSMAHEIKIAGPEMDFSPEYLYEPNDHTPGAYSAENIDRTSLGALVEKLTALRDALPKIEGIRFCLLRRQGYYDGDPEGLYFYPMRHETQDERRKRVDGVKRIEDERSARELAEYERLKRKFG